MLRAGGLILVAGMLATVVAMAPLVSSVELPSLFWWLAVLLVASGLGLVILGLLRNGRRRSRMQRAARAPQGG
jgi:membrane protein implicated in regulation of membrane protease activity